MRKKKKEKEKKKRKKRKEEERKRQERGLQIALDALPFLVGQKGDFGWDKHIVFQGNCNYSENLQVAGELFGVQENQLKALIINGLQKRERLKGAFASSD